MSNAANTGTTTTTQIDQSIFQGVYETDEHRAVAEDRARRGRNPQNMIWGVYERRGSAFVRIATVRATTGAVAIARALELLESDD